MERFNSKYETSEPSMNIPSLEDLSNLKFVVQYVDDPFLIKDAFKSDLSEPTMDALNKMHWDTGYYKEIIFVSTTLYGRSFFAQKYKIKIIIYLLCNSSGTIESKHEKKRLDDLPFDVEKTVRIYKLNDLLAFDNWSVNLHFAGNYWPFVHMYDSVLPISYVLCNNPIMEEALIKRLDFFELFKNKKLIK